MARTITKIAAGVLILMMALGAYSYEAQAAGRLSKGPRLEIISKECDDGLKAVVESQILKYTAVKITKKEPTHRMTIACHWDQSPPGSTSFYSSWGNADLSMRVQHLEEESTVYAESSTQGAKSRGLAMKKAAAKMVKALIAAKVFPKK